MDPHVHSAGLLDVRFACDAGGRTRITRSTQRFPLRVTLPHHLDDVDRGMAFLIVQNPAGAVFAGDVLELRLAAGPNARVHLRTQSATRICRMDDGQQAVQEISFTLSEHAYVEYLPELTIPQAGSRFTQRLVAEVAAGGAFVTSELVAPGRRAHGERFAYERLRLETAIRSGGRDLAVDILDLAPHRQHLDAPGLLGDNEYTGSLIAACPGIGAARLTRALDARLAAVPGAVAAAGELPGGAGAVARVLAPTVGAARAALRAAWEVARRELVGLPLPARLT
jgi:urease accessory protein